jgi:hypothetical protein
MSDRTELARNLARAKRTRKLLSDPERWLKYGTRLEDRACLLAAATGAGNVNQLVCINGRKGKFADEAYEFARFLGFERVWDAMNWNDTQERTHEEVLARLDKAIAEGGIRP